MTSVRSEASGVRNRMGRLWLRSFSVVTRGLLPNTRNRDDSQADTDDDQTHIDGKQVPHQDKPPKQQLSAE